MSVLDRWMGLGTGPPEGGLGPPCAVCGQSAWVEIGGGSASHAYHPNLDVQQVAGVDVVHDFESGSLPFHDGHAERIKMIHVLNHLSAVAAENLLMDCLRVLRPGGQLFVMVTDMEFIAKRLLEDGIASEWGTCVWGTRGDTHEADFHRWGYTRKSLRALLEKIGFGSVLDRGPFNAWEFKMEARRP